MALNPYARFLDGGDARAVMGSTVKRLDGLMAGLSAEQMERPWAPGKWTPREIVVHLADVEIAFCFRIRQALAPTEGEAHSVIQPFDQDAWARRYGVYDAALAMALFRAARGWNMRLLETVTRADLERMVTHPERGTMTFAALLESIAGHDLNHLSQLEQVVG